MLRKLALVTAAGATLAIGTAFAPSQASAMTFSYGYAPSHGLYVPAYYRYYGWRRPYVRYRWRRPYARYYYGWRRPYARYYGWRRPYARYYGWRRWW